MNIPPSFRPVFIYNNGHWHKQTLLIELKDDFLVWDNLYYPVAELKDIVGVPAYGRPINNKYHVFDFSASHLCPNQLQRIKEYKCL